VLACGDADGHLAVSSFQLPVSSLVNSFQLTVLVNSSQ